MSHRPGVRLLLPGERCLTGSCWKCASSRLEFSPHLKGGQLCEVNVCCQRSGSNYCSSWLTHLSLTAHTVCPYLSALAWEPCTTLSVRHVRTLALIKMHTYMYIKINGYTELDENTMRQWHHQTPIILLTVSLALNFPHTPALPTETHLTQWWCSHLPLAQSRVQSQHWMCR